MLPPSKLPVIAPMYSQPQKPFARPVAALTVAPKLVLLAVAEYGTTVTVVATVPASDAGWLWAVPSRVNTRSKPCRVLMVLVVCANEVIETWMLCVVAPGNDAGGFTVVLIMS